MELTKSFVELLVIFSPVFTRPSYTTFQLLMTGWILSVRHRYVTDLIVSSDSTGLGHFSDYHRFFSQAVWNIDDLWKLLAQLIVNTVIGPNGVIFLAADDTLCRKRGLTLFGAGMHHDPLISSRGMKLVSWGHDWVILYIVVENPFWAMGKVFSLPICMRLYKNRQGLTKGQKKENRQSRKASSKKSKAAKRSNNPANASKTPHKTRPDLLREMLELVSKWFPERRFVLVADSLYSGKSILSRLPGNIDMIGCVHSKGKLYEPATNSVEKRRGPRRKKGEQLSSREEWCSDKTRWKSISFRQYGLHANIKVKERTGLYYKAGKDRILKFVLSQDKGGSRPTQIFYSTILDLSAYEILSYYARRWSVEVTHRDAKQHLGFDDPANRVQKAVERTAPMAMFLYSLTVVWFHQTGHKYCELPWRPWYPTKTTPSFADMLTTLRQQTWDDKLSLEHSTETGRKYYAKLLKCLACTAG